MPDSHTLTIVKPDAFGAGKAGKIIAHLEAQGFRCAPRACCISRRRRPRSSTRCIASVRSYGSLVTFMTSGPCMPLVLEKADAVASLRKAIGATDPKEAEQGTVRALFAESKERNAIHASDSDENAARESRFFFSEAELLAAR